MYSPMLLNGSLAGFVGVTGAAVRDADGSLAGLAGVTGSAVRDADGADVMTGAEGVDDAEEEVEEEVAGMDEAVGGAVRETGAFLINFRAS
jgi:hypothetical protein